MRICRRPGVVLLLACLPSCSLSGAADTEERVKQVEAMLAEELGTDVKLECPSMVDNRPHYCTATVPGEEDLAFPVQVTSHGEDVSYATKRWVTGSRMVELGEHALKEKFDIAVDSLTCPTISHMPDDTTVRCKALSAGVVVSIDVSMVVKVRKLDFEPVEGVISGDDAVRVAHEKLLEQGLHADVKCPRRVVVSVSGKRFQCEALMQDGTISTIHYLITGTNGTFDLGTEPPKQAAHSPGGPPK